VTKRIALEAERRDEKDPNPLQNSDESTMPRTFRWRDPEWRRIGPGDLLAGTEYQEQRPP
jgi:hypothetical protein